MINYPIHISDQALNSLKEDIQKGRFSKVFVLVDENTRKHCYPRLAPLLPPHLVYEIMPGEEEKNLTTCTAIWDEMTQSALDRKALVVNIGGGVIGDMGGFVAGTYKRGIDFAQVPTTLLAQVDASVGGKLGIDFHGLKNHIGLFRNPVGVYINPQFLDTLPFEEKRSGFAEIVKHHLIADHEAWKKLVKTTDLNDLDYPQLIRHSIDIKSRIVESDPEEKGARKALNFGHTVGHAVETYFLENGNRLLHGEAIAIGMICEAWISHQQGTLSGDELDQITAFFLKFYPKPKISPAVYPTIIDFAKNDKKNQDGNILCTLLNGIGDFRVNISIDHSQITKSLDYYNEQ